MAHKKQKGSALEKAFLTIVGLYVLLVSLFTFSKAISLWPFAFFVIVSLFSAYALHKIIYRNDTRRLLGSTLIIEGVLSIFLLYPTPLALGADFIGVKCSHWSGVVEKCADNISFLSIESLLTLMVPMVLLAIFAYQKTK